MNTVKEHLEQAIAAAKQARDQTYSLLKVQEIPLQHYPMSVMKEITDALAQLNCAYEAAKRLPEYTASNQEPNGEGIFPPHGYRWVKPGETLKKGDGFFDEGEYQSYKHVIGDTLHSYDGTVRPLK